MAINLIPKEMISWFCAPDPVLVQVVSWAWVSAVADRAGWLSSELQLCQLHQPSVHRRWKIKNNFSVDYQVEFKKSFEDNKNCFLFYLSGAYLKNHSTSSKSAAHATFFTPIWYFLKNFSSYWHILQTLHAFDQNILQASLIFVSKESLYAVNLRFMHMKG